MGKSILVSFITLLLSGCLATPGMVGALLPTAGLVAMQHSRSVEQARQAQAPGDPLMTGQGLHGGRTAPPEELEAERQRRQRAEQARAQRQAEEESQRQEQQARNEQLRQSKPCDFAYVIGAACAWPHEYQALGSMKEDAYAYATRATLNPLSCNLRGDCSGCILNINEPVQILRAHEKLNVFQIIAVADFTLTGRKRVGLVTEPDALHCVKR